MIYTVKVRQWSCLELHVVVREFPAQSPFLADRDTKDQNFCNHQPTNHTTMQYPWPNDAAVAGAVYPTVSVLYYMNSIGFSKKILFCEVSYQMFSHSKWNSMRLHTMAMIQVAADKNSHIGVSTVENSAYPIHLIYAIVWYVVYTYLIHINVFRNHIL